MGRCKKPSRRGSVSLVELAAVMVASSALMSVTIAALVAVQRADQRFARRLSDRQALGLLAEQLRRDVHAAERAVWDDAANKLTLQSPGGAVTYERKADRWSRYASSPGQPPARSREPSAPARDCTITPATADAETLLRIAWTTAKVSRDPGRRPAPPAELVISVGSDLALLHQ